MMSYSVDENSTVTFRCKGTGFPEPDITWYRNGVPITDARFSESTESMLDSSSLIYRVTGSLTLNNTYDTDTDTGYSCTASNTFGNASDSFGLTVNCKLIHLNTKLDLFSLPFIVGTRLITSPIDQTVTEFSNAAFNCTVSGYEIPSIEWSFMEQNSNAPFSLLFDNFNGVILEMTNGSYEHTSIIVLTNVSESNAGLYQCTGSNTLANITEQATLTVNCKLRTFT